MGTLIQPLLAILLVYTGLGTVDMALERWATPDARGELRADVPDEDASFR